MAPPLDDGPLGELVGALPTVPSLPFEPIHSRVLEVALDASDDPAGIWVLAAWAAPKSPQALHHSVRERVEATVLQELSRSATSFTAEGRKRFERGDVDDFGCQRRRLLDRRLGSRCRDLSMGDRRRDRECDERQDKAMHGDSLARGYG